MSAGQPLATTWLRCLDCRGRVSEERAVAVDVSRETSTYGTRAVVCPECAADEPEVRA